MTVHFYSFSDRSLPSSRQRTFLTAEELERRGYSVVIHEPTVLSIAHTPWPRKGLLILDLIRTLPSIKRGDVVYLHRTIYSKYFFVVMVAYIVLLRPKVIFDIDDPVYVYAPFKSKVFAAMADAVIVSTHGQMAWAKRLNPRVYYIHFPLDPALYRTYEKNHKEKNKIPVIGWIGTGPEHLRNFKILVPVLHKLRTARDFSFVLIGTMGDARVSKLFEGLPEARFVERIAYGNPESAPKEVQKFDIGIVPHQSEGEWNKAKTSMKVLEYMAAAVPPIASNFGEMPYIIEDGVNGFLASSTDEWVEKLILLIDNPSLRERLGRTAQQTVVETYALSQAVTKVTEVIRSI